MNGRIYVHLPKGTMVNFWVPEVWELVCKYNKYTHMYIHMYMQV